MSKNKKNIDLLDINSITDLFTKSCKKNDLPTVKYILTSRKLFIRPDAHDIYIGLLRAAEYGNLKIVDYLLFSKDLEKNPSFSHRDSAYVESISKQNQFHVLDFLLEHKIFNPEITFVDCHKYVEEPTPLTYYLVNKCNVTINGSIQEIIDRNPLIGKVFLNRELNKELEDKPGLSNKKLKL
jgi:hypothetical protein